MLHQLAALLQANHGQRITLVLINGLLTTLDANLPPDLPQPQDALGPDLPPIDQS